MLYVRNTSQTKWFSKAKRKGMSKDRNVKQMNVKRDKEEGVYVILISDKEKCKLKSTEYDKGETF